MFQLYKKRSFGDMISDTFSFLKATGKHFFKNYFTITGIFLLIVLVLSYFVFKVYFEVAFSSLGTTFGEDPIEQFFGDNLGMIISVGILFFLMMIFVGLLNYSFPVSYFRLYERNKLTTNFTSKDIITEMKSTSGKLLIYFLTMILFTIVMLVIFGFFMGLLANIMPLFMLLIMLLFIFIGVPILYVWLTQTLYFQLNSNEGIISAMGNGWSVLMNNFWSILGSTIIVYIIVSILTNIIAMIPYIIGMIGMIGMGSTQDPFTDNNSMSFFGIMMTVTMIVSLLVSFIGYNLLFINQGMIFYSSIEQKENKSHQSEIDLIGTEK